MKFISTRGQAPAVSLTEAIRQGAAADGGLYVPDRLPPLPTGLDPEAPLAEFAGEFLQPFFAGDVLESELRAICREAFDFPVPLIAPDPARAGVHAFELFHGPT